MKISINDDKSYGMKTYIQIWNERLNVWHYSANQSDMAQSMNCVKQHAFIIHTQWYRFAKCNRRFWHLIENKDRIPNIGKHELITEIFVSINKHLKQKANCGRCDLNCDIVWQNKLHNTACIEWRPKRVSGSYWIAITNWRHFCVMVFHKQLNMALLQYSNVSSIVGRFNFVIANELDFNSKVIN